MGIEQHDDGTLVMTGLGIDYYRLTAFISALRLEVTTGLKYSKGSVAKAARQQYGCKSRSKLGLIYELEVKRQELATRMLENPGE